MHTIIDCFQRVNIPTLVVLVPIAILLVHIVPYLPDPHGIRLYPGPFLAKFSDAWLGWVSSHGHRSEIVHEMHKKYGSFTFASNRIYVLLTLITSRTLHSYCPKSCIHRRFRCSWDRIRAWKWSPQVHVL